uniref:Uncharacterized protein n=1 Tax=Populus trichocarpa TaxID=3694 RepID=B9IB51_POPTR
MKFVRGGIYEFTLHQEQDRALTTCEKARLQGFLDCYQLYGHVKERAEFSYGQIQQILPADRVVNDSSSTSPIAAHDWLDTTPWLLQRRL